MVSGWFPHKKRRNHGTLDYRRALNDIIMSVFLNCIVNNDIACIEYFSKPKKI